MTGQNGDGRSAAATLNRRSRKMKKRTSCLPEDDFLEYVDLLDNVFIQPVVCWADRTLPDTFAASAARLPW